MQVVMDPSTLGCAIGLVVSGIVILMLVHQKVSSAAVSYSVGALLAFYIGTLYLIGGTETPLHTWIGFFGGCFLLGLALIQSILDFKKQETND